ncbi:hypothetical protein [Thermogemmatispora onikobensis]|uniref:hypothetical protein n=1 Tax=Thermogemmatispora onikobensis TaxID=732234 RepID=UPI000852DC66|nr:hypothetical protein [Thermogemmatispora onikobensis]
MKRETPQESVPLPLARVLLPVGYGAPLHRTCIDQALVCLPRALLVEVRWSSRSRLPGWGGAALRRRYGARYLDVGPLLGNSAYREPGQIRIAALPQGVEVLLQLMEQGHTPLLLLCGCAEYLRCHRRQICEAVQAADPSVTIWQPEQVLLWLASLPRQEGPHTCSV